MSNEVILNSREPKILYFDIETSNLKADWGEMLMVGWKWAGEEETHLKTICDFRGWKKLHPGDRDKPLIGVMREQMEKADVIVGHYSSRFDYRFINTRAIIHGEPILPNVPHVDTWKAAKFNLALSANTMRNIADTFNTTEQKDKVSRRVWRNARAHDEGAIRQIAEYCMQDVRTQEAITLKLLPLLREMPNMQLLFGIEERCCPRCGSTRVKKNGTRTAQTRVYTRYLCNHCGASSIEPKAIVTASVQLRNI